MSEAAFYYRLRFSRHRGLNWMIFTDFPQNVQLADDDVTQTFA